MHLVPSGRVYHGMLSDLIYSIRDPVLYKRKKKRLSNVGADRAGTI